MEHWLGDKWGHKIPPFNQAYMDKESSEIDLTSKELEQLSVTINRSVFMARLSGK